MLLKKFKPHFVNPNTLLLFQVTSALVVVRDYLREACGSEFSGNGVFYNNPFHDAHFCYHVYCLLPMEDEQRTWFHHVLALLCIRCYITHVRIRLYSMSRLKWFIRKHNFRKWNHSYVELLIHLKIIEVGIWTIVRYLPIKLKLKWLRPYGHSLCFKITTINWKQIAFYK